MVTAIVLMQVERKSVNRIAETLADIDGVSEVYSVSGHYDLVGVVRVKDNEALSDIVTESMLKIDGILKSETMLAFRRFSRYELERMFAIGNEEP